MPQQMCRECHRLVSEAATACPHCGITRPVSADGPLTHLRPYASALLLGVALVWVGGFWFRYQVGQLHQASAEPPPPTPAQLDPHPGFRPLQGGRLGAPVFDRESRVYVGRITSLNCPSQPSNVVMVACLQIEFADGQRMWVQRSTAEAKYLTPKY